ncbi:hypothetical protein [Hydrogenovibrio sp. SC-1]|uniref:hypothetical protein n=1 Tax=Hydrogenovibrio sp. SC-1 TaxID=2065820 RepID=UPI001303FAA9|nr:hypothetical protein [Hydrogenovibrio sp. SC-1]
MLNDFKSSTYKQVLVRVLLRIADGHPGVVIDVFMRKQRLVIELSESIYRFDFH